MPDIPKIPFLKKGKTEIGFEIFTLKKLLSRQGKLTFSLERPARIDFYNILIITEGSGVHYIDFNPYRYSKGTILFISRGQVSAFEVGPGKDGFVIMFTESFLSKNLVHADHMPFYRLYNYHLQSPFLQLDDIETNRITMIFKDIYEEFHHADDFAREEIIRLLLKLLLLKTGRIKGTLMPQARNTEWLLKFDTFKNHLEKHYTTTRNANDYARMMNISYKHLNLVCKSIARITTKAFIDKFIILEIKRHLAMSNISIKSLTYELGFDEPTNLVKFFKKHTQQTPYQFRLNLSK